MYRKSVTVLGLMSCMVIASSVTCGAELIPPLEKIKADRPRVLLRPNRTPYAVSLGQLKAGPRDDDFQRMLAQLRNQVCVDGRYGQKSSRG